MRLRALIFLPAIAIALAQADRVGRLEGTDDRGVFQKLYMPIDAAIESGNAKDMAAVALSGAEIRSGAVRESLSSAIARYNAGLTKGTRIISKSTVLEVQLSGGDTALLLVRMDFAIVSEHNRTDRVFMNRDTWALTGDGWKLKERILLRARAILPRTDPEATRAVGAELRLRATPLATVEAGSKTDDLRTFGKAVGDARIVALGEASHGTREFFQMKHRLLEYLVKEKGFTVFAIEANWPEALAVDRYIKAGESDVTTSMSKLRFWTWNTEEVRDMIEWMRAFNRAPGNHPILTFTGFDMQYGHEAAQQALAYLKQYSPAEAPTAEAAYGSVGKITGISDDAAKGAAEQAAAVLKVFDSNRTAMEKLSSLPTWRRARQAAAVAYQAASLRIPGNGPGYRDHMMAKNVEWLADEAFPSEKIVLWAHNAHVRFGADAGVRSMGTWLRDRFGRSMYVMGFAFRRGQLRARSLSWENYGQVMEVAIHDVPPAREGSGDAVLSAAGIPLLFLDMSEVPKDSRLGIWLAENHLYYSVGAAWQVLDAEANLSAERLSRAYDGLVFIEVGHAAHGLQR